MPTSQKEKLCVLGIDPGVASTGWGVVEESPNADNGLVCVDYGVIKTSKEEEHPSRLQTIYKELKKIVKKFNPDIVAIEKLYFCKNLKTAMKVGEARGVTILALSEFDLPIKEFTPLQIKDAVCGYGKADKHQVQSMVQSILAMEELPKPDDAADGLAVAICCATSVRIEEKLNSQIEE